MGSPGAAEGEQLGHFRMWASQLLLPYSFPQSPQRITHILANGCVVLRSLVFRTSSCLFELLSPAFIRPPHDDVALYRFDGISGSSTRSR